MTGTLYIVGVGPGDPELLTLKARRVLEACPVICAPKGRMKGQSAALAIVEGAVSLSGKELLELHFPMEMMRAEETRDPSVLDAWTSAAEIIIEKLHEGLDVAFPTLGDPAFYSTAFYVVNLLRERWPEAAVRIIPGVPAASASAAQAGIPISLGDDKIAILPATYAADELADVLSSFDAVVLMKVHRVLERVLDTLDRLGLTEDAVIVEKAGHEGGRVIPAREARGQEPHYFSTLILRRSSVTRP